MPIDADTTEMCSCCGQVKPLSAFRLDPRKRNGRQSWCLACEREYERQRYLRRRHAILRMRASMYGLPA